MNPITGYMKDHNLDHEAMAKLLQEKMGRNISAEGVRRMAAKKEAPKTWLTALGIAPKEPAGLKGAPRAAGVPGAKPSAEIQPIPDLPFEITSARTTIELIYTMAGKGAAMGTKTPDVATLWEKSAPALAEGWIEWAKENRTVANVIAMMTIGGPGGQVVLTNASLIISTLMMVQQKHNMSIIPPQFVPPHEDPGMDDDKIRENTEAAVDHGIGIPPQ